MTSEDACAGCLVATALCPVAALCGPCVCCAANIVAWHDEKIAWFRNVDGCCQYLIIDQHEIEVFVTSFEHIRDTPRYDADQLGSHRLIFDTCTTHLSSAASVGLCSGTFSTTDHSSEASWLEGCTSEDEEVVDEADSVLAWSDWYCEDGHALAWDGEQMWCKACDMSVSWPIWHDTAAGSVAAHTPSQQHTLTEHASAVSDCPAPRGSLPGEVALATCHESRSLRLTDGEVHRKGLGGQKELLIRPGFQAGGGTSGPWWTATDAKFLGN